MKRLLQIALLLVGLAWCAPAQAIGVVNTAHCTSSPCATGFTISGGSGLTVAGTSGTASQAMTAASCSPGCGTLTHCPGSNGTDGTGGSADCYYTLNATGTGSNATVSVTFTGGNDVWVLEFSYTGTLSLDQSGTRAQSSNTTSAAGVSLSALAGTDMVVQIASCNGTISAITAGWTGIGGTPFSNGNGAAYNITSSNTAPSWTQTSARDGLGAVSFKETASSTFRTQVGGFLVGP